MLPRAAATVVSHSSSISATSTRRPSRAERMPARTTASDRVAYSPPTSCRPWPRTAAANSSSSSTRVSFFAQGTAAGVVLAPLEQAQPIVQIVVGRGVLAVDVHQVVLGRRGVAGIERGERAVLVLQHQARHVRIVAGQHELRELSAHRHDRPEQIFQHVGVVDADLQHDAARHAGGLVAPGGEIDLAEAVAADVGLGVDELAEPAGIDLLPDPAEVALAPALIAERQHHAGLAAGLRDGAAVGDGVGDRLVEEDVLAGGSGGAGGGQMHIVRRRVDDRLDLGIGQHRLVALCRAASYLAANVFRFSSERV